MNAPPRAARLLEQALLGNIVVHIAAIITLPLILAWGLPGGPTVSEYERITYVAEHRWLWRLGWLPWHLAALADLITGIALVATRWVPKLPAVLTLLATLGAILPEQHGEIGWVSEGVELAVRAHEMGDPDAFEAYLGFEEQATFQIAAVGASLYLLMALGWTWCFAAAGTWSRALSWLSPLVWGMLAVGSVSLLLPVAFQPGSLVLAVSNGVGFLLLIVWLVLVTEQVLRRSRPDESHGRLTPWRHPSAGRIGAALATLANSRVARALGEWLPTPAFRSDIRDVIYINYLVEANTLLALVPSGLELQRLGPQGQLALVSILTYRHGHFGPAFLGPLRRLLPSPVQSNWRIYVRDPITGKCGISFFTNAITGTAQALGARLLSEGMPMHLLARGEVHAHPEGVFTIHLDPGVGSGPDLEARLTPSPPMLPESWTACWPDHDAFLAYAVPQDRALSVQPWYAQVTRQEIELNISPKACMPLAGEVRSQTAQALVGNARPVCFHVARVDFFFAGEEYDHHDDPVPARS